MRSTNEGGVEEEGVCKTVRSKIIKVPWSSVRVCVCVLQLQQVFVDNREVIPVRFIPYFITKIQVYRSCKLTGMILGIARHARSLLGNSG